jgi:hypothetical protein
MTSSGSESETTSIKLAVSKRLQSEGRWSEAVEHRDQLMREARQSGMSKDKAQEWAYAMLDQMFPAENAEGNNKQPTKMEEGDAASSPTDNSAADATVGTRARDQDAGVTGLDSLPASWPTLPANAALGSEIQWVQANRLSVTRTVDGVAVVDLSRAMTPAPSWSALGWLETSIRAYSKFVDVAARVSANTEDDREATRREKLAIEEIRDLLAEMTV